MASSRLFLDSGEQETYITAYELLQKPALFSGTYAESSMKGGPQNFFVQHLPSSITSWDTLKAEVTSFMLLQVPKQGRFYRDAVDDDEEEEEEEGGEDGMDQRRAIAFHLELEISSRTPSDICYRTGTVGSPDISFGQRSTGLNIFVGEVEFANVLGCPSVATIAAQFSGSIWNHTLIAFARLHEHMVLSGTRYGVLTCGDQSWFCFRGETVPFMAISEPIPHAELTFAYFWYLLYLGMRQHDAQREIHASIGMPKNCLGVLPAFDGYPECLFRGMVKDILRQGIEGMYSKSIHRKLKLWKIGVDFTGLGGRPYPVQRVCTILRATYKGQKVVLKIRDMSYKWKSSHESLLLFLREILVYKRLKALQGAGVPKLLDYGFASGSMLGILVLSEGGVYHDQYIQGSGGVAAALVSRVHDMGVYHGEFDHQDLLITSINPLTMTLVSFSKAGLAKNVSSDVLSHEVDRARCIRHE